MAWETIYLRDSSGGGDLPIAYGAAGGHSVVRGQMVGSENPSWLIPTSDALAGMSGRLDSMGLST